MGGTTSIAARVAEELLGMDVPPPFVLRAQQFGQLPDVIHLIGVYILDDVSSSI